MPLCGKLYEGNKLRALAGVVIFRREAVSFWSRSRKPATRFGKPCRCSSFPSFASVKNALMIGRAFPKFDPRPAICDRDCSCSNNKEQITDNSDNWGVNTPRLRRLTSGLRLFCNLSFVISTSRVNARRAFTLIELLVVITIIVILMGLLFPVFRGVQDQAKKTHAKNDVIQIVTAVNAFYTEYGKYPSPSSTMATSDLVYGDNNNGGTNKSYQLMDCLMAPSKNAADANGPAQNPRQIAFIQPKSVTDLNNPRGGIDGNGNFYDPWGRTYAVATDNSYDNVTVTFIPQYSDVSYTTEPSSGVAGISGGVIAYSFGKDAQQGTSGDKKFKGSDDVLSWQ